MTNIRRRDGYSLVSIIAHWLAAIMVIALFLTHEGDRGSAAYFFHVSIGSVFGLFLLWRVWHRVRRGMTEKSSQAEIFNIAAKLVIWAFLAAIVIVVLTGYFLPWSLGRPLDVMGLFSIPSPMASNHTVSEILEEVHELSGQIFIPLLILHVLGTAKHAFIDKDGIARRMFRSVSSGV